MSVSTNVYNNQDTAAGSTTSLELRVTGASGANAFFIVNADGTQAWTYGIDRSNGNTFTLHEGTTLSTSPAVRFWPDESVSFGPLNVTPLGGNDQYRFTQNVSAATGSGNLQLSLRNQNTTDGGASFSAIVGAGSTGDALFQWQIDASTGWTAGIDNNDSDTWKLGTGNSLPGTVNVMNATTAGEVTFPTTPAFLATHGVLQADVTGNNTYATCNFTTEVYDQNGDYDGTNTFTAPVSGRYFLCVSIYVNDAATATVSQVRITTSNRNYEPWINGGFVSGQIVLTATVLADMDASDTATAQASISGIGADTADFPANTTTTYFCGKLAC